MPKPSAALVRDLASQSGQLSRTPVSGVVGLPADPAGRALLTGIALSVDDRTNAIVVAGSEEVVAAGGSDAHQDGCARFRRLA